MKRNIFVVVVLGFIVLMCSCNTMYDGVPDEYEGTYRNSISNSTIDVCDDGVKLTNVMFCNFELASGEGYEDVAYVSTPIYWDFNYEKINKFSGSFDQNILCLIEEDLTEKKVIDDLGERVNIHMYGIATATGSAGRGTVAIKGAFEHWKI